VLPAVAAEGGDIVVITVLFISACTQDVLAQIGKEGRLQAVLVIKENAIELARLQTWW